MNNLMNFLQIRYMKLHFTIQFQADGYLPYNKASALRGGMGHALMLMNCFGDEDCPKCDFREDCLVRRMMYPEMKIRPDFMKTQDSEGFIVECENHDEQFHKGDTLNFNLLLFGRVITYFSQYLQAFYNLGMMGLGKEHLPFRITTVTNTTGDTLVSNMDVFKENFKIAVVEDYVKYRILKSEMKDRIAGLSSNRLIFHSPLTLKYRGKRQEDFSSEAILSAVERRLYILNCFEGRREGEDFERTSVAEHFPKIKDKYVFPERVKRYSGTHHSKVVFSGIRGWCDMVDIDDTAFILLLAGELIHIGKNTSFGFGRFTMV